mgnify:FL=1
MNTYKNICSPPSVKEKQPLPKIRTTVFVLEFGLIIFLLVLWLSCDSIRRSKNLWVLFFYSFPSQFLIAIVPHEPVFFYFSKFYPPIVTTLVSVSATLITEALNYSVFKFVLDLRYFRKIGNSVIINKLVDVFNKAPFSALLVAGFTPVPFYPLRFLVVLAHYPVMKYLLAVFLSRTPRFYLFALLGRSIKIPDYFLLILFIFLVAIANIPFAKKLLRKICHC